MMSTDLHNAKLSKTIATVSCFVQQGHTDGQDYTQTRYIGQNGSRIPSVNLSKLTHCHEADPRTCETV